MDKKILSLLLTVTVPLICSAQAIFTPDGMLIGKRSVTGTASVQINTGKGLLMRDFVTSSTGSGSELRKMQIYLPPRTGADASLTSSPCFGSNTISFYYEEYGTKEDVKCRQLLKMSDRNSKSEIRPLGNMLSLISDGKSYNGKNKAKSSDSQTSSGISVASLSSLTPTGLMIEDEDTVAYTFEIIPILSKAINELKEIVDSQQREIDNLKAENYSYLNHTDYQGIISVSPNPTSGIVEIKVCSVKRELLSVVDLNGFKVFEATTSGDGEETITVDLSSARKGLYHVILVSDNKPCDIARLIKE